MPEKLLRRMVEVVEQARRCDVGEVAPRCLVDGLAELIPGIGCEFCEMDLPTGRELRYVVSSDAGFVDDPDATEKYLRLRHQHPTCQYYHRTGRLDVVQSSDFLTMRQLHRLEIYQEDFKLQGVEHILGVNLPTAPGRTRVYLFSRDRGQAFTDMERSMLTLLQPHLYDIYKAAERRRQTPVPLTARQLEVLRCLALGMDNNAAARQLQVSPATVAKHLENIYSRLGVTSRTAALARVFGEAS
jgi:DNA-binding CsgD family transcriptional regulator